MNEEITLEDVIRAYSDLMLFYKAENIPALIDAQAEHVRKLQLRIYKQDKSLEMRELVVKEDYGDELVTKVIEDRDNKLTNLFSKVFEDISKMSKEGFRAKMELVKGSDLYIDTLLVEPVPDYENLTHI